MAPLPRCRSCTPPALTSHTYAPPLMETLRRPARRQASNVVEWGGGRPHKAAAPRPPHRVNTVTMARRKQAGAKGKADSAVVQGAASAPRTPVAKAKEKEKEGAVTPARLLAFLWTPCDASFLAFFRVMWGMVMVMEIWSYVEHSFAKTYHHFHYEVSGCLYVCVCGPDVCCRAHTTTTLSIFRSSGWKSYRLTT